MTKNEIIEEHLPLHRYQDWYHKDDIEKMMDIWAKNQSVAFGEWIIKNAHLDKEKNQWFVFHDNKWNFDVKSTDQLYAQFIESQNKQ